jgi:zinc protease
MTRRVVLLAAVMLAPATLAAQQFPTTPPPAAPIKPASFPPFQEATLANGMRLVVVESHKQPVVSVSLSLPAGEIHDPTGKEGLSAMVAGLLTKGAAQRSADQISETIEGVGGTLAASAGEDFLTVLSNVLTPNAPLAFELMSDVVMRPTFPESEVELLRTQTLSALQLEMSQPGALASRFFSKTLYGTHPYGRSQTTESVRAIRRADLLAFHRARIRPSGTLLVVAGDINLADARRLAAQAFRSWTGVPVAAVTRGVVPTRARTEILLVHRPGSVQSNILVGNTTFAPADPRYYSAVVANRVLGGGGDSRLFTILREQKSWTYGSYSSLERPRGVGYFQASAEVRTEVTDSALVELLAQLRRIGREPVGGAELEAAKGALVGSFPLTIETASQVAGAVARAKLLGLPADYLSLYRTRLAAVTAAQLTSTARAVIRPDASVIVVVGDAAKIHDKLKAIAPVRMVSVEGRPLAATDLVVKSVALDLDMSRLVPRRDSFTIMVQGNPLGFQTVSLEKTGEGWRYLENAQLATILQSTTELLFTDRIEMKALKSDGKFQGQDLKTAVTFANGRASGNSMSPGQAGIETKKVDTEVPAGVLDENALQALTPALKWAAGAKWTLPVFASGQGTVQQLTLTVAGKESVTVPAGTFEVYRVDVTGGQQPATYFVTTAAPHRLVKVTNAGAPIEVVLAK